MSGISVFASDYVAKNKQKPEAKHAFYQSQMNESGKKSWINLKQMTLIVDQMSKLADEKFG